MTQIVGKTELEVALGWSQPTLYKIMKKDPNFPVIQHGGRGRKAEFDLEAVREYVAEHYPDLGKKHKEDRAPDGPSARKRLADAEMAELKLAQLKSELVAVADVRAALEDGMVRFGRFFDTLISRLKSEFGMTDDALRRVREMLDQQRTELVRSIETGE